MPVRQAAGDVAVWEIALAVVLMLVAIALIVRLGGRIYAGCAAAHGRRSQDPGGAAGRARVSRLGATEPG